jgi:replicative DNA helicase
VKGAPHNWETERTLLGGLLLDSGQYPEIAGILATDDFSRPNHRGLFTLIGEVVGRYGSCDIVSLLDAAESSKGGSEDYGGAAYLAGLPSACPSVDNLPAYAKRLREHALNRRLLTALQGLVELAKEPDRPVVELIDTAQATIAEVGSVALEDRPVVEPEVVVDEVMRDIEERTRNPGAITGVATGLLDLDRMLCGLQRRDQVIVAARPSMGKTALMMTWAVNIASRGVPVGIVSLEMDRASLIERAIIGRARVDAQAVRSGNIDSDQWRRLGNAAEEVRALPIHIDDRRGPTVATLRQRIRRMHRRYRLGVVMVDYLGLIAPSFPKSNSEQNTSHNSRELRALWAEIDVPGVVLCQLNRGLESRSDKRPMPSDLRDSGAVEQDADVVVFIYRDEVYNDDSSDRGTAELIVAKQRKGPTGKVRAAFQGHFVRFDNLAVSEPDRGSYY